MLNFNLTHQGNDHPETGSDVSLLAWLADYSLDGGFQPALAEDLFSVLDPDGGFLGSLSFEEDGGYAPRDIDPGNSSATDADGAQAVTGFGYSAGPDTSGYVFGAVGPLSNGIFTADAEVGFPDARSPATASNGSVAGSGNQGGEIPAAQDLIFLDDTSFARGGEKGKPGGGGGGGGGGGSEPGVLSEYTSGGDSATSYNITIDFKGDDWTVDLQQAFIESADLLSSIITDDIADVFYRGKIIDDIVIKAELKAIDGEGGILGQAGPTAIRIDGGQPATAVMQFDVADATVIDGLDLWEEVVLHEMFHSIGFGTVWNYLGLVDNTDPNAPVFLGENAKSEYGDGTAYVPLEESGGSGTALSHWDEETFTTEIMTGWINYDPDNPAATTDITTDLSDMTIASLEDIGYETIWIA